MTNKKNSNKHKPSTIFIEATSCISSANYSYKKKGKITSTKHYQLKFHDLIV